MEQEPGLVTQVPLAMGFTRGLQSTLALTSSILADIIDEVERHELRNQIPSRLLSLASFHKYHGCRGADLGLIVMTSRS